MTCIVGLKRNKEVWIGGDSVMSTSSEKSFWKNSKVFRNGPLLFGFSGNARFGQLLEHILVVPEQEEGISDFAWMVGALLNNIHAMCKKGKFELKSSGELPDHIQLIIGYNGNLYELQEDFSIGIPANDFTAIGGGNSYALGVLYALKSSKLSCKSVLTCALDASSFFTPSVGGEYSIIKL